MQIDRRSQVPVEQLGRFGANIFGKRVARRMHRSFSSIAARLGKAARNSPLSRLPIGVKAGLGTMRVKGGKIGLIVIARVARRHANVRRNVPARPEEPPKTASRKGRDSAGD